MHKIPFQGAHEESRSGYQAAQECINLYPEINQLDTKQPLVLHATPGTKTITTVGDGPIRGEIPHKDDLYVVSGNDFYKVSKTDFTVTQLNLDVDDVVDPLNTSLGPVSMASSGNQGGQIGIADGTALYVWYDETVNGNISAISAANPAVVTVVGHGLNNGDQIRIEDVVDDGPGGDLETELNGNNFIVQNVAVDTFELKDTDTSDNTNVYASGGTIERFQFTRPGFATETGAGFFNSGVSLTNDEGTIVWTSPGNISLDDAADATAAAVGGHRITSLFTAAATDGSGTFGWADPTNVLTDNGAEATVTLGASPHTSNNVFVDGGLITAVPSGATIVGIEILTEIRQTSGGAAIQINMDYTLRDETGAAFGDTRRVSPFLTNASGQIIVHGSPTDLWGLTATDNTTGDLTPAVLNDVDFAASLKLFAATFSRTWAVDVISIRVYYNNDTEYIQALDRTDADLPNDAVVTGIEVDLGDVSSTTGGILTDREVYLSINSAETGENQSTESNALTSGDQNFTYGGAGILWGLSTNQLSPSIINSAQFGIQASFGSPQSATTSTTDAVQIDYISMNIFYDSSGVAAPTHVEWFENYWVVNRVDSGSFFISNNGAQIFDAINDFATAERDPDAIAAVIKKDRELWFIGTESAEAWFNSGADFPFDPITNAFSERGTVAAYSAARWSGGIVYLTSDDRGAGQIQSVEGFTPRIISTASVEWQLNQLDTLSDAVGYCYYQGGHEFYVLTFPTAKVTWVYDFNTDAWHRWRSFQDGERHMSSCHAYWRALNKHVVGSYDSNKLLELTFDTFTDDGTPIERVRTSQHMSSQQIPGAANARKGGHRKRVFYHSFELDIERGHDPQGQDPNAAAKIGLSWSDDGGKTFTDPDFRDLGEVGEDGRLRWQMLGSSYDRVFRVFTEADIDVVILDAYAIASVGSW